jgi:hypothetical protein
MFRSELRAASALLRRRSLFGADDISKTPQMQAETGIVKNSQIAAFAYLDNLDADFHWVANFEICAHALGRASVQR